MESENVPYFPYRVYVGIKGKSATIVTSVIFQLLLLIFITLKIFPLH